MGVALVGLENMRATMARPFAWLFLLTFKLFLCVCWNDVAVCSFCLFAVTLNSFALDVRWFCNWIGMVKPYSFIQKILI